MNLCAGYHGKTGRNAHSSGLEHYAGLQNRKKRQSIMETLDVYWWTSSKIQKWFWNRWKRHLWDKLIWVSCMLHTWYLYEFEIWIFHPSIIRANGSAASGNPEAGNTGGTGAGEPWTGGAGAVGDVKKHHFIF